MSATAKPEHVALLKQYGREHWLALHKKAQNALYVYAAAIVVAIALRFLAPGPMVFIGWALVSAATIYVGAIQVPLLPFMNAKPAGHWTVVALLALFGCGGILWFLLFLNYNNKAKAAIELAAATASQPQVSPYPR
ncbi:MAG TPA: hypothetical protein VNI20_13720 [Fimbriimonadaceae bacterium]|nr:hypothetical protein [Fimbriimonadaceae bacterium]